MVHGMQGNTVATPPLSLPIGGWPTPSIPPSGGGAEYGSNGPAGRGNTWQRELRKVNSPPFEPTSPRGGKRRTTGSFFKPATVSSSVSGLGATPRASVTARLPEAPSTGSISYRPAEFMGATAPRRKPARLRSSYPSPRCLMVSPRSSTTTSQTLIMRAPATTPEQLDAADHKLWEKMRRERQRKQRESDLCAYRHVFRMLDANDNGLVDPAEVLLLLKTRGHSGSTERNFWRAFKELDIDKSQAVDFNEFAGLLDHLRGEMTRMRASRVARKTAAAGTDVGKDAAGALESVSADDAGALPSLFADKLLDNESSRSTLDYSVPPEAVNVAGGIAEVPSRPSTTTGPQPSGTEFMTEAVEFQRQLLDVYCAVNHIREVSLREMIVDPEEDSRVRTETGRSILNYRRQPTLFAQDRPQVQVSSFEDVADLAISLTGGISNQKGKKLQQQRRELERTGKLVALRKTQLAVRSTFSKNVEDSIEDLYSNIDYASRQVLKDFFGLFEIAV